MESMMRCIGFVGRHINILMIKNIVIFCISLGYCLLWRHRRYMRVVHGKNLWDFDAITAAQALLCE